MAGRDEAACAGRDETLDELRRVQIVGGSVDVPHLVEVENQVQLAHVPEVPAPQSLDEHTRRTRRRRVMNPRAIGSRSFSFSKLSQQIIVCRSEKTANNKGEQ